MSDLEREFKTYQDDLDLWIKALGLPQNSVSNTEVENIIGLSRESLRERSSIQLSEDTVTLSQYTFFLQHKLNECQTFIRWSRQISGRLFGDDQAKITAWVRKAELRTDRIAYLTRRIEVIGQSISGLVRARYNEGNNR